jgi:hypothetical protein
MTGHIHGVQQRPHPKYQKSFFTKGIWTSCRATVVQAVFTQEFLMDGTEVYQVVYSAQ